MNEELKLIMLKQNLEILHGLKDEYLKNLINIAEELIRREGVGLNDSYEDCGLVTMYAAYLYRKRAADDAPMPRMLRYALNNRLLNEKMKVEHVTG